MSLSATEATFEGFRVTRARPFAVLAWAVVWLFAMILMMLATTPLLLPYMAELQTAQGDAEALSPGAQQAIERAGYVFIAAIPFVQALLLPALFRAVMRSEDKGFGYIRIGPEEGRMLIVGLVITAISLVVSVGGTALETVVAGASGTIAGGVVSFLILLLTVWLSVRIALIPALTFRSGRLAFKAGWQASARRFWPLLGVTIMSVTAAAVVIVLLILIAWPLASVALASGGQVGPGAGLAALIMLLIVPVGMALVSTIVWAPFPAIVRDLSDDGR